MALPASAASKLPGGFEKAKWEMPPEMVQKLYPGGFMTTMHGNPHYRIKYSLAGNDGAAEFNFDSSRKLIRVAIFFPPIPNLEIWVPKSNNPAQAKKTFDSVVGDLKKRYGEPHSKKDDGVQWSDETTRVSAEIFRGPGGADQTLVTVAYWNRKAEPPNFPPPPPDP